MEYLTLALAIVGGVSAILKGLEVIAGITASTKDDLYVSKAIRYVGVLASILDKIALNPKK
jgi:hypothetical protein|tara:strand:- start:3848 stop:4030 length:183 start_codon:yes stop_codon:yes gene_type:complete